MKDLRNISVIGLGLLGGSISLAARQRLPGAIVVGYSHRSATRKKARDLAIATEIANTVSAAVTDADLIILATPIFTFADYFTQIRSLAQPGCIVTDVGSTKVLPHQWAEQRLGDQVRYVGSHPVAGSEQRGVEFARDDLLAQARCILTTTKQTSRKATRTLRDFWTALGCFVETMAPEEHDRVYADVSHLPHLIAAALVNASDRKDMKFAGKGFLDSTRIASGDATIWTDVLLTNTDNLTNGIDRMLAELAKLRQAVEDQDKDGIETLLTGARRKRAALVKYMLQKKELLS
ncbi:MAG: prephenate dehydrogenase/arogenate dehydrogenase family protein [Phycisphaerales bacterium]|nr:MAG: prephenate dehydrogenase/arogenate dehydrogenase family protein [Phycisphaerales bacterium]